MALLAQALAGVTAPPHLPRAANFQGLDLHQGVKMSRGVSWTKVTPTD